MLFRILVFLLVFIVFSCEYKNPVFNYSNFYDTPAEGIVKAIKEEDVIAIRREVENGISVDFKDGKYDFPLLSLSIVNDRNKSFIELLKLNANPNIEDKECESPLILAIRYSKNCNLSYINKLLDYNAEILPEFFKKCNYFTHDPIVETILHYNTEDRKKCGLDIINLLVNKLNSKELLFLYNNSKDYRANIIFNCLSNRNLSILKYLIVDLNYQFPESIYIDGTVLPQSNGFFSLKKILQSHFFIFNNSDYREQAKKDILDYLNNNND